MFATAVCNISSDVCENYSLKFFDIFLFDLIGVVISCLGE
ncbi:hypothetical protein RSPO_m00613 (plasmid) [Ralstonia solanacearum Po82]|uniref:Uncharacterized protein n=1 Tax=Ralstonia solanacearum (strain Po82) TaxID=1031711 RepID=F6G8N2_RALS8|nr:hypothetical protein RSPO_m00613 [Ralstonia solanacearum Po82]